jgi:uncharacterized protein (DUF934 family)
MPDQLIKGRQLADNVWTTLSIAEGQDLAKVVIPSGRIIVPAPLWLARREELLARVDEIAVSLAPTFEVEALADDVSKFALIVIEFPKFADGRGYSTARLLRERYAYRGELRAVGDVGRDQLFFLSRVGFDAFLIPEGRNATAALASFSDFPETYQTSVDQPLPLFRRRAA